MKMESSDFDKAFKEKLHNTFKFTIDFFKEHELSWFCAFGTAIGAVRHNDIIPWDDDLDIFMPRADYDKLLTLKSAFNGSNYTVVSYLDDGYCLPFAKIMDKTTTIWEAPRYPFVLGVYIDIFPLDYSSLNNEEYEKAYKLFAKRAENLYKSQTQYSFTEFKYDLKNHYFGAIATGLHSLFYPKCFLSKSKEKFRAVENVFFDATGNKCVSFSGTYGTKEIYQRAWFEGYIEFPFHDYQVRVPVEYDKYLKQIYGNYMKLPPENKRVTHHGHYYLNLKERIGVEEIKKRIREGENLVY